PGADPTLRDLVLGVAEQGVGQRRLAGAVGPHQGVHLAGAEGQVDALQDLVTRARSTDMQVIDLEEGCRHGSQCISPTRIGEIPRLPVPGPRVRSPAMASPVAGGLAPLAAGAPVTLLDGASFCISGAAGDIAGGVEGLIVAGHRLLSRYVMTVNGRPLPPPAHPAGDPSRAA